MLRYIDLQSIITIEQIVVRVASHVNVHTSQHVSCSLVLVFLHQNQAVLRVFILKVKDVEGGTILVGTATLCLDLLYLNLVLVSGTFLVHELPPFHISVILLNSKYDE